MSLFIYHKNMALYGSRNISSGCGKGSCWIRKSCTPSPIPHLYEKLSIRWKLLQKHRLPLSVVEVDIDLKLKWGAPVVNPQHIQSDLSPSGFWWIPHYHPAVHHLHLVYATCRISVGTLYLYYNDDWETIIRTSI